jgi:unsaturated chondroitin disaccharide hydrolase
MLINYDINVESLLPKIQTLFEISARKIHDIDKTWNPAKGTPVYTVKGKYSSRGWTEWTRGFQYGSAILQFEVDGDKDFLELSKKATRDVMAIHISHMGVHDHGFNVVSTYGNLLRLMQEGLIPLNDWERDLYRLALKVSGAVQASRWTNITDGLGYIYSFNGPHSLFADTIRSLRVLAISHQLGHVLMSESDQSVNLLRCLLIHAETTARYNVYYGAGRDVFDLAGRVAHESIFNIKNGLYRCPSSQQGYSPFTTWTRGLAWIICGYAEQLEFINSLTGSEFNALKSCPYLKKSDALKRFLQVAQITADYYIANTPLDGIPYWDTGAPGLVKLSHYLERPAQPFNNYEPVDSSAAVIAAQGLLRLGHYLCQMENKNKGKKYFQAGLTIANNIFSEPYLSLHPDHQGLILHSIYHRPNNWDYIPKGRKIPCGESSMWGDYHARELALYIKRQAENKPYLKFYL